MAPGPRRFNRAIPVVAVTVVTVVALSVAVALQTNPGPSPSPTVPGTPSASGGSPTPVPSDAAWGPLQLVDVPQIASLEAAGGDDAGLPADAAFTLTSRSGEPVRAIAARLEVSPAATFAVEAADDRVATLRPQEPLAAGATYRVTLRAVDGALAGSWAFPVRGPVHVTATSPGDATTDVPLRAGIDVLFDQDGVEAMDDHFRIEPAVAGHFERSGRRQVFVPDELQASTLYRVTISRGLARTGTDLVLEDDVVLRFETTGPSRPETTRLAFGREVLEVAPGDRPIVALDVITPDDEEEPPSAPTTADVAVYRFASLDAASEALAGFLAAPRWASLNDPRIDTTGLAEVARFTAPLETFDDSTRIIRFPEALPAGWYVVELAGDRVAQAFLQVTPLSAWVAVETDRTVVWVNDVVAAGPAAGASVSFGDRTLGQSDADGLLIAPTAAGLVPRAVADTEIAPAAATMLHVTAPDGATVLVPFDVGGYGEAYRGEWSEKTQSADETWWTILDTDRGVYRTDDTIEVWGFLRKRDGSGLPATVDVRLVASGSGLAGPDAPAIRRASVAPDPDGSYTASLRFAGLPVGSYTVEAVIGGRVVTSRWVEITVIRKPPYEIELTPDRLAVIEGTAVRWTAVARFFDGTPAPGLALRFQGVGSDPVRTTDADGRATVRAVATRDEEAGDPEWVSVIVDPTTLESAEISAEGAVLTFASSFVLDARGTVSDGVLHVRASIHEVDLPKVRKAIADGSWDGDAAGQPAAGQAVRVIVTELIPVRRQVGTAYDFIERVARPLYEYDVRRERVAAVTLQADDQGRIRLDRAIPDPTHEYEVVLSARDDADRTARLEIQAGIPYQSEPEPGSTFVEADGRLAAVTMYDVGDRLQWRITTAERPAPTGGPNRYLYLVSQRGLKSAAVTDSPVFDHRFDEADAPAIFVIGVRFTGTTYAPKAATWAVLDPGKRELRVDVTADRSRYRPGEDVTLTVRTRDRAGDPVAAIVLVRAVDEKLFAMGGASVPYPLEDLYRGVDSGILRLTATHQVPGDFGPEGEGGDTTGGGEARSDFRDTIAFQVVRTDASGTATLPISLSDDLTSWHVTAAAVTTSLQAGVGEAMVPVGLPFFVEATVADSYLVADRPVIALRAFGDALRAGDPVTFTVRSTAPPMSTTVDGTAFTAVEVALPDLVLGRSSLDIRATAPRPGGTPLADRLIRTYDVLASRVTRAASTTSSLRDGIPQLDGVAGLTTLTFSDVGRGSAVPILVGLADPVGSRLDALLAQSEAHRVLVERLGYDPARLPPVGLIADAYEVSVDETNDDGSPFIGARLLPWSGPDPWLAARIALDVPGSFQPARLAAALRAVLDAPDTARDLGLASLAGLAALGEPVLPELHAAAALSDLSLAERIHVAWGLAAAGDHAAALRLERQILAASGEQLGDWARVRAADPESTVDATISVAVVAAMLGDPVAGRLAAYAVANPARDTAHELELVAYAVRAVDRAPTERASFAVTVDGHREVVTLADGQTFALPLTRDQLAGLSVELLSGEVDVAASGRIPLGSDELTSHAGLTLTRAIAPAEILTGTLVRVTLTATIDSSMPDGCYELVETVPSGLAPVSGPAGDDGEEFAEPSSVVGQEVRFCAWLDEQTGRTVTMRYLARVVNTGTFVWEPAVLQHAMAADLRAVAPATTITIRGR